MDCWPLLAWSRFVPSISKPVVATTQPLALKPTGSLTMLPAPMEGDSKPQLATKLPVTAAQFGGIGLPVSLTVATKSRPVAPVELFVTVKTSVLVPLTRPPELNAAVEAHGAPGREMATGFALSVMVTLSSTISDPLSLSFAGVPVGLNVTV